MIKIVLADDHQMVRQGLKLLLKDETDFNVIAEAGDGLEAVRLVEQYKPDVLVLDLVMRGISGLEVTRQLSKKAPQTGIVILSMHDEENYVIEALRSGAKAYILKNSSLEEFLQAIREVAAGRRYLSLSLSERAIRAYTLQSGVAHSEPYDQLTLREREILQLCAQGYTNAGISSSLYISPRTVETHRSNIMRKLNLHNHNQLIRFAIQHGILSGGETQPLK